MNILHIVATRRVASWEEFA